MIGDFSNPTNEYDGFAINTPDEEKINFIMNKLKNERHYYIDFNSLKIPDIREKAFVSKLSSTGMFRFVTNQNGSNPTVQLNDEGFEILDLYGSYIDYQKYLKDKEDQEIAEKEKEKARKEVKDSADGFDLKIKKWTYKLRYWPFGISILSVLFTGLNLWISSSKHKESQSNLQSMKSEIQSLKTQTKRLDSLFQKGMPLKKGSVLTPKQ